MAKASLPPGFRFHPTDVELVCYYLKRKIMRKPLRFEGISEIELYKFAPWDLPEKSGMQSKDLEWYFFCPGGRKYANGLRKNRATDIGYWKTTGKDRSISYNSQTVARRKTLVFHLGRAPNGNRTDWVMYEYRLEDKELADTGILQDTYVLCRIFEKSGPGPKNGEQYGAPFQEEDWGDDEVGDSSVLVPSTGDESLNLQHNWSDQILQSDAHAVGTEPHYSSVSFNAERLLQELSRNNSNNASVVPENNGDENPAVANGVLSSDGDGIYDGLEDLPTQVELKSAGDIYFSNNVEECGLLELPNQAEPKAFYDIHSSGEPMLEHSQLGTDDGSYMEMKDFLFPVEGHCSYLVDPGNLFGHSSFQSLSSSNILAFPSDIYGSFSGMEGLSGNTDGQQDLADFHGSSPCQTTDKIERTKSIQSSTGGEPDKLPSESPITSQAKTHSKLRHLFSSIHGRPAIAAEYPSALAEEKLGGRVSYYRSSIHVKAEVTLQCPCTEDSRRNARDDFHPSGSSARSAKQMPSRKIARESYSSGSGFAFVFFLGVVSALMWIFLLTLFVKLGGTAWKLFRSDDV